jgi:hypothetical protein
MRTFLACENVSRVRTFLVKMRGLDDVDELMNGYFHTNVVWMRWDEVPAAGVP